MVIACLTARFKHGKKVVRMAKVSSKLACFTSCAADHIFAVPIRAPG